MKSIKIPKYVVKYNKPSLFMLAKTDFKLILATDDTEYDRIGYRYKSKNGSTIFNFYIILKFYNELTVFEVDIK